MKTKNKTLSNFPTKTILSILAIIVATGGSYGSYVVYNKYNPSGNDTVCEETVFMQEVLDGDTFTLENGDRIRLSEIDAPETNECYGKESTQALDKLLRGQDLQLTKDIQGADNFGRLIRYVTVIQPEKNTDNILVNKFMLQNGYAKYSKNQNSLHERELVQAENSARQKKLGLWGSCPYQLSESEVESARRTEQHSEPTDPKCLIKGNISETFGRKYFLPHCRNYSITKIDLAKGENYFCSTAEALKANFLASEDCK